MADGPGTGEIPGGKPAPLFQTHEVKVAGGVVRKGAKGIVGDTTVSIQPNEHGVDDLEVAFLRKGKKGKDQFVGEPIRINAGQEDLEEVADTLTRQLAGGAKAEDVLKHLEEAEAENTKQMLEGLRAKMQRDFGTTPPKKA